MSNCVVALFAVFVVHVFQKLRVAGSWSWLRTFLVEYLSSEVSVSWRTAKM